MAQVLVFDVNETLLDFDGMAPLFQRIFGDVRVLREWMCQLFMYSMAVTLSGQYVDYFTLGEGVLQMVADIHGVAVTDHELLQLRDGMLTLPAYPDVKDGLSMLRDNGFRLVTLTNSPPNPHGLSPLEYAGVSQFFEQQFSIDANRVYKPATEVYQRVAQQLDVTPSSCMMVAAHVWDTMGAQGAGFGSALITRPGNAPLPVGGLPQPTLVVSDLRGLAQSLVSARG